MSDKTETRWFKIVTMIIAGFFVGFSIANVIYFNRIRTESCMAVTRGEATTMLWVNIALLVIATILFLWSLVRLIFSRDSRQEMVRRAGQYAVGTESGMTIASPKVDPEGQRYVRAAEPATQPSPEPSTSSQYVYAAESGRSIPSGGMDPEGEYYQMTEISR